MVHLTKSIKDFNPPSNVIIFYGTQGNFNDEIISNVFFNRVIDPFIRTNELENVYLLIDQAQCHTTSKVKQVCTDRNVNLIHIPKRMTNLLQPADVSWMRPFKHAFQERWNNWFINVTNTGNMRSPGYSVVITWLSEIWQEMTPEIIRKSFDQCGITSVQNGDLHNRLRHYVLKKQMVEDVIDENEDDNLGFMTIEEFESSNESVDFEDDEE